MSALELNKESLDEDLRDADIDYLLAAHNSEDGIAWEDHVLLFYAGKFDEATLNAFDSAGAYICPLRVKRVDGKVVEDESTDKRLKLLDNGFNEVQTVCGAVAIRELTGDEKIDLAIRSELFVDRLPEWAYQAVRAAWIERRDSATKVSEA